MNNSTRYNFFADLDSALSDYRFSTNVKHYNEDYKKATKNIKYFEPLGNNILMALQYGFYNSSQSNESFLLQSDGLIVFYNSFFAFSNKKGFNYLQGIVNYSDISEISICFSKGGFILIFLNNGTKLSFSLKNNGSSKYILARFGELFMDARFPFTPIIPGTNNFGGKTEEGRFVFIHD